MHSSESFHPQPFSIFQPEQKELSDELILELAYTKALHTETDQILMNDFIELYGDQKIEEHKKLVEEIKIEFAEKEKDQSPEIKKFGKILEAILIEQIEQNNWLGENMLTSQTTEYDDFINGIDFVTEWDQDGMRNFTGFAIDATCGVQSPKKKFRKIQKELYERRLGEVFYLQSRDQSFQGRQKSIPKIVLGLDRNHVIELSRLWLQNKNGKLKDHPLKNLLIEQLFFQLKGQLHFVEQRISKGDGGFEKIRDLLSRQIYFFEQRLGEKQDERKKMIEGIKDESSYMIFECARLGFYEDTNPKRAKTKEEYDHAKQYEQQLSEEQKLKEQRRIRHQKIMKLQKLVKGGNKKAKEELKKMMHENELLNKKRKQELEQMNASIV